MKANCTVCGTPFDALRSSARYCGSTCRKRASRAKTSGTPRAARRHASPDRPALYVVPTAAPAEPKEGLEPPCGTVERYTRQQLGGDSESVLGAQCIAIARRIDSGRDVSGSAVASLSKELDRLIDKAIMRQLDADTSDPLNRITASVQLKLAAHG